MWTPGLVTRCEKVCRLFRHNSDPVFCSQRYFPDIFQISVTKDQAYESPICYAIYVFASLRGDVATGCEKKKKSVAYNPTFLHRIRNHLATLTFRHSQLCLLNPLFGEKHGSINVKNMRKIQNELLVLAAL